MALPNNSDSLKTKSKVLKRIVVVKTHQSQGKKEDEENPTGEHGEAQQANQLLVLVDAGESAVQSLILQLLVVQQVLPLGWHD